MKRDQPGEWSREGAGSGPVGAVQRAREQPS